MEGTSLRSPAVMINEEDSICNEDDTTDSGKFTLTFYPDEADPLEKEKMQRIWNYIESKSEYKEMMATFSAAKEGKTTDKLKICMNDIDQEASTGESYTNEMNNKEDIPKRRHQTAIELLDHFRELHMFGVCLKKTEGKRQSDCLRCPSTETLQENLDDIQSQIKHYEENLVTQVIGEKRAKQVYKYN